MSGIKRILPNPYPHLIMSAFSLATIGIALYYGFAENRKSQQQDYVIRAKVFEKKYVPLTETFFSKSQEKFLLVCTSNTGETLVINKKAFFGKADQGDSILIKVDKLDGYRDYLDILKL